MIRNKIVCLFSVAFFLVGCDENDQVYYNNNLDKAIKKFEQCQKDVEAAIATSNTDEFKKVQNDKECEYSEIAIKEDKKAKAKAAAEANKIEAARLTNEFTEKYKNNDWTKNIDLYKKGINKHCSAFVQIKSAECLAWNQFWDNQEKIISDTLNKLDFPKLDKLRDKYCISGHFMDSYSEICGMWRKIHQKKELNVELSYINNPKKFESTFNACVEKVKGLNYSDSDKIIKAYPCKQIKNIYLKAGYSYDNRDFKRPIKMN